MHPTDEQITAFETFLQKQGAVLRWWERYGSGEVEFAISPGTSKKSPNQLYKEFFKHEPTS